MIVDEVTYKTVLLLPMYQM